MADVKSFELFVRNYLEVFLPKFDGAANYKVEVFDPPNPTGNNVVAEHKLVRVTVIYKDRQFTKEMMFNMDLLKEATDPGFYVEVRLESVVKMFKVLPERYNSQAQIEAEAAEKKEGAA